MIDLKITCLCAPLVIEGTVNGMKVFFRSRHDRWRFNIGDAHEETGTGDLSVRDALVVMAPYLAAEMIAQCVREEDEAYDRAEREHGKHTAMAIIVRRLKESARHGMVEPAPETEETAEEPEPAEASETENPAAEEPVNHHLYCHTRYFTL